MHRGNRTVVQSLKQTCEPTLWGKQMKHAFRKASLRERLVLVWGKLRRFYYHNCNTRYIRENHARRTGECARCGACCWLAHPCFNLAWEENGLTYCKIHKRRVKNCRIFPIDEKDIADRDLILPDVPCGYSFKPK